MESGDSTTEQWTAGLRGEDVRGELRRTNLAPRRPDNVNLPTSRGLLTTEDDALIYVEMNGIATLRPAEPSQFSANKVQQPRRWRFQVEPVWRPGSIRRSASGPTSALHTVHNRVGGRSGLLLAVAERALEENRVYLVAAYDSACSRSTRPDALVAEIAM
jgi:hypothetical protein